MWHRFCCNRFIGSIGSKEYGTSGASVTHDEWMDASGRRQLQSNEEARRNKNPAYVQAIDALSKQRKRTAMQSSFMRYCQTAVTCFKTMESELMHIGRSRMRWQADRALQKFMARVANRMFRRDSIRPHRHSVAPEDRAKLKEKLKKAIDAPKTVWRRHIEKQHEGQTVSDQRSLYVPKKKLLKVLAVTGLTVLLGEYNTSKTCPCGMDSDRRSLTIY